MIASCVVNKQPIRRRWWVIVKLMINRCQIVHTAAAASFNSIEVLPCSRNLAVGGDWGGQKASWQS